MQDGSSNDLVEANDAISKLPIADIISSTDESLAVADEPPLPTLVKFTLIFPPALKKNLMLLAFANVTVCSTTCAPVYLVPDCELCNSEPALTAVALVDPAATAAAKTNEGRLPRPA